MLPNAAECWETNGLTETHTMGPRHVQHSCSSEATSPPLAPRFHGARRRLLRLCTGLKMVNPTNLKHYTSWPRTRRHVCVCVVIEEKKRGKMGERRELSKTLEAGRLCQPHLHAAARLLSTSLHAAVQWSKGPLLSPIFPPFLLDNPICTYIPNSAHILLFSTLLRLLVTSIDIFQCLYCFSRHRLWRAGVEGEC